MDSPENRRLTHADCRLRRTPSQNGRVTVQTSPADSDFGIPLCVDLDGTLIKTDLLWESLTQLVRKNPLSILRIALWLARSRAYLKHQTALRVSLDPARLPVSGPFVKFLHDEKERGRQLVLATASDATIVAPVAAHFGLCDEVLNSDGRCNLRGATKAALLTRRFGLKHFDYAGNSRVDLPVWAAARNALVVNASESLILRARELGNVSHVFPPEGARVSRVPWGH